MARKEDKVGKVDYVKNAGTVIALKDGFYIGKLNKDVIFNYTVLIKLKDSLAILDAYLDEKGMVTAYDIFDNKQILPKSEHFHINKYKDRYILSNSFHKGIVDIDNGSFIMQSPLKLSLKYYKEDPTGKYPSKKYSLYCYSWFYPHVILGIMEEFNPICKACIQNKMDLNLKNINKELSYESYFTVIKDSINKYRVYCDKSAK
jgi:hypothetical protein